jgi:hypothetical protein
MKTFTVLAFLAAIRICKSAYNKADEVESKPVASNKFKDWIFFRFGSLHTIHYAYNAVTDDLVRIEFHASRFGLQIDKAERSSYAEFLRAFLKEQQLTSTRVNKSYERVTEEEFIHVLNSIIIEFGETFNPLLIKYFN